MVIFKCNHKFQDMPKLSRSQGFRLHGKNCVELHFVRVLIVALVQSCVDLVQARDALVQVHLDLV